jgi:hypothetical protein
VEVPLDDGGNPIAHPGSPPDTGTVELIVPDLPAGRSLAVFAAIDPDSGTPSTLLSIFSLAS